MLTPHETAVEHLKLMRRADNPMIEQLLAIVRQYPAAIQQACEAEMKRTGQVAAIDPIKAVADQQAVEIQEMLDALTAPAAEPSIVPAMAPGDPVLPGELLAGSALPEDELLDPSRFAGGPANPVSEQDVDLAKLNADMTRHQTDPALDVLRARVAADAELQSLVLGEVSQRRPELDSPFREGLPTMADLDADKEARRAAAASGSKAENEAAAKRAAENAKMGGFSAEPAGTAKL